jgi:hypothetical protein
MKKVLAFISVLFFNYPTACLRHLISERVKDLIEKEKWRGAFLQEIELI